MNSADSDARRKITQIHYSHDDRTGRARFATCGRTTRGFAHTLSLLGATPRENAHIRTLARIGDIYVMNNTFMLAGQVPALAAPNPVTTGNEAIVALLVGHLASSTRALDRMIGRDGF
ncbi:MAG TPA: hypothetical protein VFE23_20175, partial [Usitatibacter sp.]|nr:hypothetical protein [Usitatibacter sp.]